MTQAKTQPKLTFEEFLTYNDGTDMRYELVDGVPVEVAPESDPNMRLALWLAEYLRPIVGFRLLRTHGSTLQVTPLPGIGAANRYPDLMVLTPELLKCIGFGSSAVKLNMPNPALVAEVVSPYTSSNSDNYRRDYIDKPKQYQHRQIPEHWIIDPLTATITVFSLNDNTYQQQAFKGSQRVVSKAFPTLNVTPDEIFAEYHRPL